MAMGEVVEREHVEECPVDTCEKSFIGVTPGDVRDHIAEDHNEPLGRLYAFPDRSMATGVGQGGGSDV